jgi:hypothetical protein
VQIERARTPIPFTDAQEADLGDAIAEHLERTYRVVHDDAND